MSIKFKNEEDSEEAKILSLRGGEVYRLLLSCQNRRGIVARVANHIFEAGFNIADSRQFDEVETNQFFMRIEINPAHPEVDVEEWSASFAEVAREFDMKWTLRAEWRPSHARR